MGKLLIAYFILKAERESRLAPSDEPLGLQGLRDTWLVPFVKKLFDGVRLDTVGSIFDGITVVSFNYDRCVERFLEDALVQGFHLDQATAHVIVEKFDIIHPYGSLGTLAGGAEHGLPFGARPELGTIWMAAEKLRTFTERVEADSPVLSRIRGAMLNGTQIAYLGFSYLPQNMELLTTQVPSEHPKQILGTGFGVSRQELQSVARACGTAAGLPLRWQTENRIHIEVGQSCAQLFSLHSRNM